MRMTYFKLSLVEQEVQVLGSHVSTVMEVGACMLLVRCVCMFTAVCRLVEFCCRSVCGMHVCRLRLREQTFVLNSEKSGNTSIACVRCQTCECLA